jgi:hypothetical protein
MSRIEFDGEGTPIPTIALPPFGSESDLPPTVLTFTEDTDFSVSDYMALGFTHYEVWCVGAAGGRGGDAVSQVVYAIYEVMRPVPQNVWNYVIEKAGYEDYLAQLAGYNSNTPGMWRPYPAPVLDRTYSPGEFQGVYPDPGWATDPDNRASAETRRWSDIMAEFHETLFTTDSIGRITSINSWTNWTGTYRQAFELHNSSHLMLFREVRQVLLQPSLENMGGGGGGGGLHKAFGALADLDDVVPIVVGDVGVDAPLGQVHQNGDWTPDMGIPVSNPLPAGAPLSPGASLSQINTRLAAINTYLTNYLTSYPLPRTAFANPAKGQDGGVSSFADVCQASGGEGGDPGMSWDGSTFVPDGDGGDGGIGDSLVAGGGGAGSVAEGVNGSDGTWIPDTGIGGGGGGGKGGRAPTVTGNSPFGQTVVKHLATASGQGSYSFADTSVFGARQFRQAWNYLQPILGRDPVTGLGTGVVTFEPRTTSDLVIPGTGGGARPFSNLKYGGRGTGYSPDGIVVLRLTKII